jgi:hypothetical protein
MKRHNFFMDDQQIAAMKLIQRQTGISVSEQIRRAVYDYLRVAKPIHEAIERVQAANAELETTQLTLPFTDH